MSYQAAVLRDYPVAYYPLDELSGTTAIDFSGSGNNGTYSSSFYQNLMPLVSGGSSSTKITDINYITFPITKDYSGELASGSLADKYSLDNDFSLEIWFYPNITSGNETLIFGNSSNDVGIFYKEGDIIFRFGNKEVTYTLPYSSKSHHIVATYNTSTLSISHDGELKKSISISPNELGISHSGTTFYAGPAVDSLDYFLIDAPAVYRHALSQSQTFSHFINNKTISGVQVALPDNGIFYNLSDENIRSEFRYSYPFSKPWTNFVTDDTVYDSNDNSLSLKERTEVNNILFEFTDFITVPTGIGLTSSKVEWSGDNGVLVETSIDGINYSKCNNGESIPDYSLGSFNPDGLLYIKVTLFSPDITKTIPKLKYLSFDFYKSKDIYAENFGDKLSYDQQDYNLGSKRYPILSRDYRNGLRCLQDGGFKIEPSGGVRTVELIYTPQDLTDSAIVHTTATNGYAASNYGWHNFGMILKTNISAIYVNGVNKVSETDIANVLVPGEMHHIVIVFGGVVGENIRFNYSIYGSKPALYQNVALYEYEFDSAKALEHYNLYINYPSVTSDDSSWTIKEEGPSIYNNDWVVIQSI